MDYNLKDVFLLGRITTTATTTTTTLLQLLLKIIICVEIIIWPIIGIWRLFSKCGHEFDEKYYCRNPEKTMKTHEVKTLSAVRY